MAAIRERTQHTAQARSLGEEGSKLACPGRCACRIGSTAARHAGSPASYDCIRVWPRLAERYLDELVPDPEVVVLDNVRHYPHLEVHDRVVDEYEAFRRRVDDGLSRTRTP